MLPVLLGAQQATEPPDTTSSLSFYPAALYGDETGFGGGGVLFYLHRTPAHTPDDAPNSVFVNAIYTANKQFTGFVRPELLLGRSRWALAADFKYEFWPDTFYGLGNSTDLDDAEDFTAETGEVELGFRRKLSATWGVQPMLHWRHWSIQEREAGGMLATCNVPGACSTNLLGLGLMLRRDDRDNTFNPHRGGLIEAQCLVYHDALGSDFAWTKYKLDASRFFLLWQNAVLGVQMMGVYNDGQPPFLEMARPGAELRGVASLRYLGRHMALARGELRVYPFHGELSSRLGFAAFAEAGSVANDLDGFALSGMKYSVGGGLRFLLVPQERLALRVDYGISADDSAIKITATEAF